MKKKFLIVLSALVVTAVVGVTAARALDRTPEVIFDAASKTFSFANVVYGPESSAAPTTENPYPDLFQVRSAMPGDSETWQVKVTVRNAGADTVKMYVRAENANDDYKTLFGVDGAGPATISATFDGGSVATKIKNLLAGADPATYTGYVDDGGAYLGAYTGGNSSKEINLTFAIPVEAGNEIADLTAEVDWVFVAEIIESAGPGPGPGPGPSPGPGPQLNTEEHYAYIIGYPNGYVGPQNNITRAETATILFRLLTDESRAAFWSTSNAYGDVPGTAWYNTAVSTLSKAGIINGYPDGNFYPDKSVTRAEYATMFSRFFDVVEGGDASFSDISGHWAEKWIVSAASRGFINGYPDGTFGPDNDITRGEAMALTNRVLGRRPDKDHLHENMVVWKDNPETLWCYADVQEATNSHEYEMIDADLDWAYEEWLEILPTRDWAALERQWASEHLRSASNVYTSKP